MMKYLPIALFLLVFSGCNPTPNPYPSNDSTVVIDTTSIDPSWEIIDRNDDGLPVFFIKKDGDSTTTVSVVGGYVEVDILYAIREDIRVEGRRMISIAPVYMVSADTLKWFSFNIIPDKIDYDKYSPN
jgi:hypothetical protein